MVKAVIISIVALQYLYLGALIWEQGLCSDAVMSMFYGMCAWGTIVAAEEALVKRGYFARTEKTKPLETMVNLIVLLEVVTWIVLLAIRLITR